MEIIRALLIALTIVLPALAAQDEVYKSDTKNFFYKGSRKSLIDLSEQDVQEWLDFKSWKVERYIKDRVPDWRRKFYTQNFKERFGKVISCVGKCQLYRGTKFILGKTYSNIKEGDTIENLNNSYAWVYLFDGSMVRISPNTSVTFQEFNVSEKDFFVFIRINRGNVYVLSRNKTPPKAQNLRDTDSLFVSDIAKTLNANVAPPNYSIQGAFEAMLNAKKNEIKTFEKLKQEMIKNNKNIGTKNTKFFVVFPNGSLLSDKLNAEFFINPGAKSFFELRSDGSSNSDAIFFYRGYRKKESSVIEQSTVYQVSADGRELKTNDPDFFTFSKRILSRIQTILLIREKWIQKYSLPLFEKSLDPDKLAMQQGYRLWTGFERGGEFRKRIAFLVPYTRKRETGYLATLKNYNIRNQTEVKPLDFLPSEYFQRSLDDYARSLDRRKLRR